MRLKIYHLWAALAAAALMLAAGGLGLLFQQPWLFPSLGPSAFIHIYEPRREVTGMYHTIVGHGIGVAAGYLSIFLCHAAHAPSVMSTDVLTAARMWASSLAIFLTVIIQIWFGALHPPATATTLLIALGAFRPQYRDVVALIVGICVIASLGTIVEKILLRLEAPDKSDSSPA